MDGKRVKLEERMESLLQELAVVKEQLDRGDREPGEIPHFSEIEGSAHDLGRRLSRAIQEEASLQIGGAAARSEPCPDCGRRCRIDLKTRTVVSVDGETQICEPVGHCKRCQRSFFPSA